MLNPTPAGLAALMITKDQEMPNRVLAMMGASHAGPSAMFNVVSLKRQVDRIEELETQVKTLSAPKPPPAPPPATNPDGTPAQPTLGSSPQTPVTSPQTPPPPAPVPLQSQSDIDRQLGALVAQNMQLQNGLEQLRLNIRDNGGNAYEVARRRLVVTDLPASSKTPNVHDGYNAAHKAQVGKLLDELKTLFVQEFSLNYPPPAAPVPPPTPPTP